MIEEQLLQNTNKTYEGRLCKRGHDSGNGTTTRNTIGGDCLICKKLRQDAWHQENGDSYKQYQKDYFQKLLIERPEKLAEYFNTQVERGHRKPIQKRK